MTPTAHNPDDASRHAVAPPYGLAPGPEDPTVVTPALGSPAAGDRCAACGSVLSGDQRYCLECGERRGQARFGPTPASTASTRKTTRTERARSAPRLSGATTLIAGVGTLLLAMGIGVLIGRTGTTSASPANSKVQVVNVGGGSGTAATSAGTGAGAAAGSAGSGKKHAKAKAANKSTIQSGGNISAANATKTVKNLPPPTVTVGQKGSGPGYQKGKFTGNFFGP